jgi:hypothetical protein
LEFVVQEQVEVVLGTCVVEQRVLGYVEVDDFVVQMCSSDMEVVVILLALQLQLVGCKWVG